MRVYSPTVQRRRSLSTTVAVAFIVFAMLSMSSANMVGLTGKSLTPVRMLALVVHDPIFIEGNGDFTGANGVTGGAGTESDPYVIEGWEISMPDILLGDIGGIEIHNATAPFVVRNCYIHGPSGSYATKASSYATMYILEVGGIWLANCTNGRVVGNICSHIPVANYSSGILLTGGTNNFIAGNDCTYNGKGIEVRDSWNVIDGNNCSNNSAGISLCLGANNNTVTRNICAWNDRGIEVAHNYDHVGSSNVIFWNMLLNNTGSGVTIDDESYYNLLFENAFTYNNGAGNAYDPDHIQAYDGGVNNSWNSTDGYGNYWSDWTAPDTLPRFGVVDLPYNISGPAIAEDCFPLTTTSPTTEYLLRELPQLQYYLSEAKERLQLLENELDDTRDDIDTLKLMQTVLVATVVLLLILLAVMFVMMTRLKKVRGPPSG